MNTRIPFDIVQIIKDRLTMHDVLQYYGYSTKKRMPCPLHNGKDDNFEIKEHSFMCYSQCGGGDVITFVQKLFGLSFQETLKKIDADFSLNIYSNHSFEDLKRSHYQLKKLQAEKERKRREKEQVDSEYWAVFDEWKRLDDNKRNYEPKTLDEELHPLYIEALQRITHQEYLLNLAEVRRRECE